MPILLVVASLAGGQGCGRTSLDADARALAIPADIVEEDLESEEEPYWHVLGSDCIPFAYPEGTVRCRRGLECPEGFPFCCDGPCGSMEFGERGCCEELYCGREDSRAYSCWATMDGTISQLCTLPEEEYRCPPHKPYCCFYRYYAVVCADHELLNWTCEAQW